MQYVLTDNKWQITYTDSTGCDHTFLHPAVLTRSMNQQQAVTEELMRSVFATDAATQRILDYMKEFDIKFDDDLVDTNNTPAPTLL
jgi:hypothetical protein